MQLVRDDKYTKKERKFFKNHQDLIEKYSQVLKKLQQYHNDSSLKLHPLKGKLKGFHSVSLTFQYRIVLILLLSDDKIVLTDIGTHDKVYDK